MNLSQLWICILLSVNNCTVILPFCIIFPFLLTMIYLAHLSHTQPKCGLPIHPYFSAFKIRWILDNVPEVKSAINEGRCLFGTVDTWIMWVCTYRSYSFFIVIIT